KPGNINRKGEETLTVPANEDDYNDQTGGSQKRVHDPMTLCPWDGVANEDDYNDQTGGSQKRVHDPMTLCPWDGVGELSGLASQAWKHQSQRGGKFNCLSKNSIFR
ncbi:6167_t:CDS:2, partial [Funneliformis caledonium]